MPFLRNIYRLSLALLMLGCLLGSGNRSVSMPYARLAAEIVQQAKGEKSSSLAKGQEPADCYLHVHRAMPPGYSDHHQRNLPSGSVCHFFNSDAETAGCTKSKLRQRLMAILARFIYPQRLSLYPRHWFW